MVSFIASAILATALPTNHLDSVGCAAYWFKKDSRGRGDSISEQSKPKRFAAFALSADTFVLADPQVRARNLDRLELWFGGRRYPAKEVARSEFPDTVTIRTESPVEGVRPLEFVEGEPAERFTWGWSTDAFAVDSSKISTNANVRLTVDNRTAYNQGQGESLILDKDRRPLTIDFGELTVVEGGRFRYGGAVKPGGLPADSMEKAAEAVESRCASAALPVVITLEQKEKSERRRGWYSSFDEQPANESDAMGVVVDGKVLLPCALGAEDIARFKKAEATLPDGTKTNLTFLGALAEWKALVLALPEGCADKVGSLSVFTGDPLSLKTRRAWSVTIENESGRSYVDALRSKYNGVEFIRGAQFVARCYAERYERHYFGGDKKVREKLELNGAGEITTFYLNRRYGERYGGEERMAPADIAAAMAGGLFNPEFRPRAEEDRNRIVWLGVECVELTDALAREKRAQSFVTERYSRPPLVTEVYPGSPCAKAGITAGDVLLGYRHGNDEEQKISCHGDYSGRDWSSYFNSNDFYSFYGVSATPWTDVENETNRELSKFGVGAKVTLVYVRDGRRCEREIELDAAPVHYKNATKSRNRTLGTLVKDMTFEVRRFFKFDDREPGVVIAKIKPGSPAAVAGLKVYELITEVNGEKVTGAKDFAAKIKDKQDLVFAVRRLSQTRMVKIHVQ